MRQRTYLNYFKHADCHSELETTRIRATYYTLPAILGRHQSYLSFLQCKVSHYQIFANSQTSLSSLPSPTRQSQLVDSHTLPTYNFKKPSLAHCPLPNLSELLAKYIKHSQSLATSQTYQLVASHLKRQLYNKCMYVLNLTKKNSHFRNYERQGTEDKRWRKRGRESEEKRTETVE